CQVLGLDAGPSEEAAFWTAFLRGLVKRGLRGVRLVSCAASSAGDGGGERSPPAYAQRSTRTRGWRWPAHYPPPAGVVARRTRKSAAGARSTQALPCRKGHLLRRARPSPPAIQGNVREAA